MNSHGLKIVGLAILILLAGMIPAHGTETAIRDGALAGTGWFESLEGPEVEAGCPIVPFRFLDTFLSARGEWSYRIGDICGDMERGAVYGRWHGGTAPAAWQDIAGSQGTGPSDTDAPALAIAFGDDPAAGKGAVLQGTGMMVLLGCSLIGLASFGRKKSRRS